MWNGTAFCDGVCAEVGGASLVMSNLFTLAFGLVPAAHAASYVTAQAASSASSAVPPPATPHARSFLTRLFCREWQQRCSAEEALKDPWLQPPQQPAAPPAAEQPLPPHTPPPAGTIVPDSFSPFEVSWE